jgi:transposase
VPPLNRLRKEGMAMTIVEAPPGITGGVDTHLDTHVAAALDPLGRLVGTESFKADAVGYKALLAWLETFGQVTMIGVEGTGSYGVGGSLPPSARHQGGRGRPTQPPGSTEPR